MLFMADVDLVGRCSSYRVTVNDGGSRQEIHFMATDESMVRRRIEELGCGVPTRIDRVSSTELRGDPLYSKAQQWALSHNRMGEPQGDCYFTSKLR